MRARAKCSLVGGAAAVVALSLTAIALARPATQIQVVPPAHAVVTPLHAKQAHVYNVTIRGFSPVRARAYLFVDYGQCATTYAAEQTRAPTERAKFKVRGTFAEVSGWESNSTGTDYACAYLVAKQSGELIARAKIAFQIFSH